VIHAGDAKHPHDIKCHAHGERCPAETGPNNEKTSGMNSPERGLLYQVHGVERVATCAHCVRSLVNVKTLPKERLNCVGMGLIIVV